MKERKVDKEGSEVQTEKERWVGWKRGERDGFTQRCYVSAINISQLGRVSLQVLSRKG